MTGQNAATARAAWDENPPAWITVLAEECDLTSQARAGRRIGYSASVVNGALKRSYKGSLSDVQRAVEGALMGATVDCPVLGEIPKNQCLEYQRQPLAATNPVRVRLWRACRGGCPHSRINENKQKEIR